MITWTKTETRTRRAALYFRLEDDEGIGVGGYCDATPADILAAIEADEGLRAAVTHHLAQTGIRDLISVRRAESDRDAWKTRAERAEKEASEWISKAAGARGAYIEERNDLSAAVARAEKAEKERDEALAMLPTHTNVGLWNQLHNAEAALAAMTKERDEARAEVRRIREQADRPCTTCATLRTMLADAKADLSLARQAHEHWKRESERLEKELASAHNTDGQPWNMTTADAEELRARRKLDEWWSAGQCNALTLNEGLTAWDGPRVAATAPDHVSLARKLGLLG